MESYNLNYEGSDIDLLLLKVLKNFSYNGEDGVDVSSRVVNLDKKWLVHYINEYISEGKYIDPYDGQSGIDVSNNIVSLNKDWLTQYITDYMENERYMAAGSTKLYYTTTDNKPVKLTNYFGWGADYMTNSYQ